MDDNPSERELVKTLLPEVVVPDFPKHIHELPKFIEHVANEYFLIHKLTQEDQTKTEQYKANAARVRSESQFSNMEDYLKSLEIHLKIETATSFALERMAQLTQKTNQFNLCTKRYTATDIQQILDNGGLGWTLSVEDKYGDYGMTGVLLVCLDGKTATIDTLLLSCRILGKGLERAFVLHVLDELAGRGIETVEGIYNPTSKNSQVANFYSLIGFERLSADRFVKTLKQHKSEVSPLYTINK